MSKAGQPRDILTKDQRQEIIAAYQANEKYYDMAARFGVSDSCIWKVLWQAKVTRTRHIVTDEELIRSRQFCDSHRFHDFAFTNPPPPSNKPKRRALDEYAFDIITPESAYWIGFLMADGCALDKPSPCIVLQLSGPDRDHIVKFQSFMKTNHKITEIKPGYRTEFLWSNGASRIALYSKRLKDVLSNFGVVPRKSLLAEVRHLELHPDFWRGVVDGDGSIASGLNVYGSKQLMHQFGTFCLHIAPHSRSRVRKHLSIYSFETSGKTAALLADALYNNDGPSLDRKKRAALDILHRFQGTE